MDTQEWAARAEIVASLAVIVTLGFVIYEVRQNTAAIERQTTIEREARIVEPYLTSPEFRRVYASIKDRDGPEPIVGAFMDEYDLAVEDAVYWVRHLEQIWTGLEADFHYMGRTDDNGGLIVGLFAYPDNRLYWSMSGSKGRHGADFVTYVEQLVARHPPVQQ